MQTARIQLDWGDLDLGEGRFDEAELREALESNQAQGLSSYVGIYAIDTEGLVVPVDLVDVDSPTGLAGSRSLNHPDVLARYRAVLDWAVPMIVRHGGYALSIANEPEGYVEDRPSEDHPVRDFYRAAIDHAQSLDNDLATTVTFTSAVLFDKPSFFDEVVEMVDVVSYNYYCVDTGREQYSIRRPVEETVVRDFDVLVDEAKAKEVVLHELGCPAGWTDRPALLGSDEETQRRFFRKAFSELQTRPSIRVAVVFQMVDWSEALFDSLYRAPLESEGLPPRFVDSFEEWLTTSGFLTFEGQERKSWQTFLDSLRR